METSAPFRGKKVTVTGGAGFIGSNLVRRLVEYGCDVVVADNLSRGSLTNLDGLLDDVTFRNVELTRPNDCDSISKDADYIFHLASPVGGVQFIKKENVANLTPAILMHTNLIEAARANDVEQFLFASSACVYYERGPTLNSFKESDAYPANPPTTYGWAKIVGERLCKAYYDDYSMKSVAVRIFNAYGENENLDPRWSHVIPSLMRKAILHPQAEFTIFGDGSQERAFLYVKDCVDGLIKIIDKVQDGSAINLGSDEITTIRSLANRIVEISNKSIKPSFDLSGPRGVNRYCGDFNVLKQRTGWSASTQLRDGLERMYHWMAQKLHTDSPGTLPVTNPVAGLQEA